MNTTGIEISDDVRSEECIGGDWPLGADEFVFGTLTWAAVRWSAASDVATGETHESLLMRLGEFSYDAHEGVTKGVTHGVP
jgi:hypothetical protein